MKSSDEFIMRIKGQLEYCDACENELHLYTTAVRIAEMIRYHYCIFDKDLFLRTEDDENETI